VFSRPLDGLLQRAHEGAIQHVGKTPAKAGADVERQTSVLRLRAELRDAVTAEDYERAAALRDQIKELEKR
jgi:protein arginine kinase activator